MRQLGELSAKYESCGDPAAVSCSAGDAGGVSYGLYQFATNCGVPQAFVEWLQTQPEPWANYGRALASSGQPGEIGFSQCWKDIGETDPGGFGQLQHDYVKAVYYDSAAQMLRDQLGFEIEARSEALKQVLWSRAVQYSAHWMPELFQNAADMAAQSLDDIDDEELIANIYEVNLTDPSWTSGSPSLRPGLFNRFRNEREEALAMLREERGEG